MKKSWNDLVPFPWKLHMTGPGCSSKPLLQRHRSETGRCWKRDPGSFTWNPSGKIEPRKAIFEDLGHVFFFGCLFENVCCILVLASSTSFCLANLFPVCDRAPHDLSTSERSSVEAVSELHGWGVLVNSLEKVPWRLGLKILRSLATWGFEHNETQAAKITWYPLVN